MNAKDEALRVAIKAFLVIHFGGYWSMDDAKTFADLCSLSLPNKYR